MEQKGLAEQVEVLSEYCLEIWKDSQDRESTGMLMNKEASTRSTWRKFCTS